MLWWCLHEAGVEPTLAGVVLGLLTPARPRRGVPVLERLEDALHPLSSFVIVPIFALANAGVVLSGDAIDHALSSRVTIGIVVGLVVGKFVGILGASALALRAGIGTLPDGMRSAPRRGRRRARAASASPCRCSSPTSRSGAR